MTSEGEGKRGEEGFRVLEGCEKGGREEEEEEGNLFE